MMTSLSLKGEVIPTFYQLSIPTIMKAKYILSTFGAGLLCMMPQQLKAQTVTWDVANANNEWNTISNNWTGGATFANGNAAVFNAATGESVTVVAGGVTPSTMTVGANNGSWTFSGGSISGALTKNGTGALTLSSANAFSGVTINAGPASGSATSGAIIVGNDNALGAGNVVLANTASMSALFFSGTRTVANNIQLSSSASLTTSFSGSNANTATLSGLISGGVATSVFFVNMSAGDSNGVLKLTNASNSFRATMYFNRGVLAITSDGCLGNAANLIRFDQTSNNGGLRFDANNINFTRAIEWVSRCDLNTNGFEATISSNISGAGIDETNRCVIKGGVLTAGNSTGTLRLSGNNSMSAALTVAANTKLIAASATAMGNVTGTTRVNAGGTLAFDSVGNYTNNESLSISGTGVQVGGVGVGAIQNMAGITQFNGPIALVANASIGVTSGSLTLGGNVSGAFVLNKIGAGTLSLGGTNGFSGGLTVSQGTLQATSAGALGTGLVTLNNGTSLATTGAVTVAAPAGLTIGNAATDTAQLNFTGVAAKFAVAGTTTINAGAGNVMVNLLGTAPALGQYVLLDYDTLAGTGFGAFTLGALPSRVLAELVNNSVTTSIDLNVTGVDFPVWSGAQSSEWSTAVIAGSKNWVLDSNNASTTDYLAGDTVVFNDFATTTTVDISNGNVSPAGVSFANATKDFTLTGGNGIAGTGTLIKSGAATLTINNSNSFTGNVQINGGTVSVAGIANGSVASPLGAGVSLQLNGGTLSFTGNNASSDRSIVVGAGNGTIKIASAASTMTVTGPVTGTGALQIEGPGRLLLGSTVAPGGGVSIAADGTLELATTSNVTAVIQNAGQLRINQAGNVSLAATITGAGSLTHAGAGTVTLSGTNNYAGGTTWSGGSLTVSNGAAIGSGAVTVTKTTGGTFTTANTAAVTLANNIALPTPVAATQINMVKNSASATTGTEINYSGVISGGGPNLTLFFNTNTASDGSTTHRLSGANTFVGTVRLNRGSFVVTNAASFGAATNQIILDSNNNQTLGDLRFAAAMTLPNPVQLLVGTPISTNENDVEMSGILSGTAGLNKLGAGKLTLSGVNTYAGATTINAGTLQIGNGGTTGNLGTGIVTNNGTLAFNRSNTLTVTNAISGSGTISQTGTGITTISGAISSAASYLVNAGTLSLRGSSPASATLTQSGGNFSFGNGTNPLGALTLASITQTGGQLVLDIDGTNSDLLQVTGAYDSTAGGITVNVAVLPTTGTPYEILTYGSLSTQPPVTVNGLSGTRLTSTVDYQTNNAISVTFTGAAATLVWSGATNNAWDLTTNNWTNGANPDQYYQFDTVAFNDTPTSANVSPILNFAATPTAVQFDNSDKVYTITGTGSIAGAATLSKSGSALVVLATDNSYTGITEIIEGTLKIGNGGTSGSLGNGGQVYLDGSLVFDRSDVLTVNNQIQGFASGALTHAGTGTVILTANNSYAGTTTINAGTLQVGNGGTAGSLGFGDVINNGILAFQRSNAHTVANVISGTGSVTKAAAGSLTLTGNNSYSGGTSVTAGSIISSHANALGTGAVTMASGAPVHFKMTDGTTNIVANDFTLPAVGGSFLHVLSPAAPTTVRLTGKMSGGVAGQVYRIAESQVAGNHNNVLLLDNPNNDFVGTIEMWRGTLAITSDAVLGNADNDIRHFTENLNGSLRFDADQVVLNAARSIQLYTVPSVSPINTQAFTATIAGDISGAGVLVKQGTGTLILTGNNTATGATAVAAGTLRVNGTFATGGGTVTVDSGATLAGSGTINRAVAVNGSISPGVTTGTLATGSTTISGTYVCDVNGVTTDVLAATNLTLGAASTLTVNESNGTAFPYLIATYSGTLSGTFASVTPGYAVDYDTPGQLLLVKQAGYQSWALEYANGDAADVDSDGDGVANALEYFMGDTNQEFTTNPSVVESSGAKTVTWPKDPLASGISYEVQVSATLGNDWGPAPIGSVVDNGSSVVFTFPNDSVQNFVRLKVTVP